MSWYLTYLWQVEGPMALLAVLEILRGIFTRSKQAVFLSVFPLVYFTFVSSFMVRNNQTLLPVLPFLFILASSLLLNLFRWAYARRINMRRLLLPVVGALAVVSLGVPLLQSVKSDIYLTTVDSRETARIWIDQNLPNGAQIAIESYAPYVDPQRFAVQGFVRMIDHTLDWYVANDFDYLVFSEGMFGRFYREPERYPSEVSQYEDMFRAFDMAKMFTDGGYEVRIYITER